MYVLVSLDVYMYMYVYVYKLHTWWPEIDVRYQPPSSLFEIRSLTKPEAH